jgi:hypothetical protein
MANSRPGCRGSFVLNVWSRLAVFGRDTRPVPKLAPLPPVGIEGPPSLDGKMLAFTRFLQDNPATIYLLPLAGGEPHLLMRDSA